MIKNLPGLLTGATVLLLAGCGASGSTVATSSTAQAVSIQKAAKDLAHCMQGKGWEVTPDPLRPGKMVLPTAGIYESQFAAFDADSQACVKLTGLDTPPPPPSVEQLKELYAHEVKTRGCLARYGYDAPEPPSEEAYVAAALANPEALAYKAWLAVPPTIKPEKWRELELACPQTPPEEG